MMCHTLSAFSGMWIKFLSGHFILLIFFPSVVIIYPFRSWLYNRFGAEGFSESSPLQQEKLKIKVLIGKASVLNSLVQVALIYVKVLAV